MVPNQYIAVLGDVRWFKARTGWQWPAINGHIANEINVPTSALLFVENPSVWKFHAACPDKCWEFDALSKDWSLDSRPSFHRTAEPYGLESFKKLCYRIEIALRQFGESSSDAERSLDSWLSLNQQLPNCLHSRKWDNFRSVNLVRSEPLQSRDCWQSSTSPAFQGPNDFWLQVKFK